MVPPYGGTIYSFAVHKSHKEVFVIIDCIGDVQWAERLNGLSTEWLIRYTVTMCVGCVYVQKAEQFVCQTCTECQCSC